jgi:hypothetical protein
MGLIARRGNYNRFKFRCLIKQHRGILNIIRRTEYRNPVQNRLHEKLVANSPAWR